MRYEDVMTIIRQQIDAGLAKPGQRIASVREMSAQSGFSLTTVHRAYLQLEAERVITARPRSGFFVAPLRRSAVDFSIKPDRATAAFGAPVEVPTLDSQIMSAFRRESLACFGSVFPVKTLFPTRDMAFFLRQALRTIEQRRPLPPDGEPALRDFVAGRAILRGFAARADDVVSTRGGLTPLTLALDTVTRPGDIVLIESPSFFPLFGLLQQRNLQAIEIYSHPQNGIDADQFEHLLKANPIRACILMPNNHYPTGVTSSLDTMRRIVRTARSFQVQIIECDDYSELSYRSEPAPSLLTFDDGGGTVIQCGSFTNILGPDFSVGWVISRARRDAITQQNFLANLGCDNDIIQSAVARYLSRKSFDHQVRLMRHSMAQRMRHGLRLIEDIFPKGCAMSRPSGGFMCWIRLPKDIDAITLAQRATKVDIGLAPGPAFSVTNSFRNFIGLNFSSEWDKKNEASLRLLGELIADWNAP